MASPSWKIFFAAFCINARRAGGFERPVRNLLTVAARGRIDGLRKGTGLVDDKSRGEDLDTAAVQAADDCAGLLASPRATRRPTQTRAHAIQHRMTQAHPIADRLVAPDALAALCRRFGVARLEVFGSAARGTDFVPLRSDIDLLVTLAPPLRDDLAAFADLKDALETLFGRRVDLLDRAAIEASRNPIRRRRILADARPLHAA